MSTVGQDTTGLGLSAGPSPTGSDPASRRLYTVGEIARAAGCSRQTLHAYALIGLIRETGRTSGGHRRFSGGVVRRLDEIRSLKEGLTLAEIRDRFASRRRGR